MTFADELLVMSLGEVIQRGTTEQLFEALNSKYVGNFIGSPTMNFLPAVISASQLQFLEQELKTQSKVESVLSRNIEIGIRPEYISLALRQGDNVVSAEFLGYDNFGSVRVLKCVAGGSKISVKISRNETAPSQGQVLLTFPKEKLWIYEDGYLI